MNRSQVAALIGAFVVLSCTKDDTPTGARAPAPPSSVISDAVHEGGTPGFYFLPPMVSQPAFTGTFDADIATLNPQIAICDITNGLDTDCGGSSAGATPAVVVFTTVSTPAITLDATTPQYQVNWDTKAAGFVAGHSYRLHVRAGAAAARRELGFADILLTTTPGQAKHLASDGLIVLQDGRTLPVHFRIETGIPGSILVTAAAAQVPTGSTDMITATTVDLHGAPLTGAGITWSSATTPGAGVIASLSPAAGVTDNNGATTSLLTAGTAVGTATVTAASGALSGSVQIGVVDAGFTLAVGSVALGQYQSCGLTTAGAAYCWGDNSNGQLGFGSPGGQVPQPVAVIGGLRFKQITAGSLVTCGIVADGTAYCWGYNGQGALGIGFAGGEYAAPQQLATTVRFKQLSAGHNQTCGLDLNGTPWCWGDLYPSVVSGASPGTPYSLQGGLTFTMLSGLCGLSTAGDAWCWDGSIPPHQVPGGHKFTTISLGDQGCGLDAAGAAWCWDMIHDNPYDTPVQAAAGLTFVTIQVGTGHTCGLTANGSVYCWGRNNWGQLGDGTNNDSSTPVRVATNIPFAALAGALFIHDCGTTTGGAVYCWGNNDQGQVGDGTFVSRNMPTRVIPPN
jgi:alpha-tubulin suppressor-like RCC1 family protein